MAGEVSFGGVDYTSNSQDSGWVQTAVTLPGTGSVTAAYKWNGTSWVSSNPLVITYVRTYLGAYDGAGNIVVSIGGFSGTYSSVPIDSTPPLKPWLAVSGTYASAGAATNFRLTPSTGGGIYFKRAPTGTDTVKSSGYVWDGPMYGGYQYINVPTAPTSFSAARNGASGRVDLSWAAPSDNGGSAVTGYTIFRGTSSGAVNTAIGSASSSATSWYYTAPDAATYYYAVRASNAVTAASGTLSQQSGVGSATALFDAVQQAPTGLTATASGTSGVVNLAWNVPASPGASSYGYKVYKNGSLLATISESTDPAETYSATGLTPGVSYEFYVNSFWGSSTSPNTATVSATAPGFAIRPASLEVSSVNTVVSTSVEVTGQLRVSWLPVGGVTSTGGYKLYRDGVQIAGVGVAGSKIGNMTDPFYVDSGLTPGQTYSYTVRAYLSDSNEIGELTEPTSGIPAATSYQLVSAAATNLTNSEFSGQFVAAVHVIDPQTFSYAVEGGTNYAFTTITPSSAAQVSSELVSIFGVNKTITKLDGLSFTFAAAGEANTAGTRTVASTVTNKTNEALSGTHLVTGGSGTASIKYSVTDAVLSGNITEVGVVGSAANLDSGALSKTGANVVSVPTSSSFTYVKAGVSVVDETILTGTVYNSANDNIYNGTDIAVVSSPRYDKITYTAAVEDSGPTSETVAIEFPAETASRTTSTGSLEIQYRSGWMG